MTKFILFLIKIYQYFLSPWVGQHCRFTPSCSNYAKEAVTKYGAIKGSWLTIKRIVRCQPFANGGYDPVDK
ncbi:MAG: membrane protein insertion efficiency factor YidD [Rickettsiaceae bacterium]|nr:membrane protein insertion efficiency factor YidD [Rickettsiaceae bacterium]